SAAGVAVECGVGYGRDPAGPAGRQGGLRDRVMGPPFCFLILASKFVQRVAAADATAKLLEHDLDLAEQADMKGSVGRLALDSARRRRILRCSSPARSRLVCNSGSRTARSLQRSTPPAASSRETAATRCRHVR